MHDGGLIHWDMRFSNIFHLPETDGVLLNDWGSSASSGLRVLVSGCPPPCCHPELADATAAVPDVKHDLYSLVFSTGRLLFEGVPSEGKLLSDVFVSANKLRRNLGRIQEAFNLRPPHIAYRLVRSVDSTQESGTPSTGRRSSDTLVRDSNQGKRFQPVPTREQRAVLHKDIQDGLPRR